MSHSHMHCIAQDAQHTEPPGEQTAWTLAPQGAATQDTFMLGLIQHAHTQA